MIGKLIVISAPSGAGKTSIVRNLLKEIPNLSFSISACSRLPRKNEKEAVDYYFLDIADFKNKIRQNLFLEWEEVYENQYYGTLKSELNRIWEAEKTVIFDVDVEGGLNIKNQYPENCLSIFIMPPSIKSLEDRLLHRGTESKESLQKRLAKATEEMKKSHEFDQLITNDNFTAACIEAKELVNNFILS